MNALLKKDLPWLLAFAFAGAVAPIAVAYDYGFFRVLVAPEWRLPDDLGLALWIPAVVLALFATAREHVTRTRWYLLHRAVAPRRIFGVRMLGCIAVIASWTLAAMAFLCVRDLIDGAGLAAISARAALVVLSLTVHAVAVFAGATFAFSFPGSSAVRLLLLMSLWLAIQLIGEVLLGCGTAALPPWAYTLGLGALAFVFLRCAAEHEAGGCDLDHRMPHGLLATSGVVAAGCAALAAICTTSSLQHGALGSLAATRPRIVETDPGTLRIVTSVRLDYDIWRSAVLDERHEPTGVLLSPGQERPQRSRSGAPHEHSWRMPYLLAHGLVRRLPREAVQGSFAGGWRISMVLEDEIEVLDRNATSRRRTRLALPASPITRDLDVAHGWPGIRDDKLAPTFVGDRSDGSLWQVTAEAEPRLVPVPIPDGDRFVSFTGSDSSSETFIAGASKTWRWRDGALVAVEAPATPRVTPGLTMDVVAPDVLTPEVVVNAPGGATLRHRFGLYTWQEKGYGGAAMLLAVLRPLPPLLASFAVTPGAVPNRHVAWFLDPCIGGRPWLALLGLALHLFMAWSVHRLLRQRGASPRRCRFWAVASACGGFLVVALCAMLETRRAYRAPARVVEPARPLIASA